MFGRKKLVHELIKIIPIIPSLCKFLFQRKTSMRLVLQPHMHRATIKKTELQNKVRSPCSTEFYRWNWLLFPRCDGRAKADHFLRCECDAATSAKASAPICNLFPKYLIVLLRWVRIMQRDSFIKSPFVFSFKINFFFFFKQICEIVNYFVIFLS